MFNEMQKKQIREIAQFLKDIPEFLARYYLENYEIKEFCVDDISEQYDKINNVSYDMASEIIKRKSFTAQDRAEIKDLLINEYGEIYRDIIDTAIKNTHPIISKVHEEAVRFIISERVENAAYNIAYNIYVVGNKFDLLATGDIILRHLEDGDYDIVKKILLSLHKNKSFCFFTYRYTLSSEWSEHLKSLCEEIQKNQQG